MIPVFILIYVAVIAAGFVWFVAYNIHHDRKWRRNRHYPVPIPVAGEVMIRCGCKDTLEHEYGHEDE